MSTFSLIILYNVTILLNVNFIIDALSGLFNGNAFNPYSKSSLFLKFQIMVMSSTIIITYGFLLKLLLSF